MTFLKNCFCRIVAWWHWWRGGCLPLRSTHPFSLNLWSIHLNVDLTNTRGTKHHHGGRTRSHPVDVAPQRPPPEQKNDSERQAWPRGVWPWALAGEQSSVCIMLDTSNMLERPHGLAPWMCWMTCSVTWYSCTAWPCPRNAQWNRITQGLCKMCSLDEYALYSHSVAGPSGSPVQWQWQLWALVEHADTHSAEE